MNWLSVKLSHSNIKKYPSAITESKIPEIQIFGMSLYLRELLSLALPALQIK